ncbi:MAG: HEAT repeat domain-containing protein [Desulfobacterales bacterium]|jgi:CheY-like chemotaxis protein/HEAT repeat protein
MTKINAQDLLDEIRFDIKEKDLIKAKLVLSALKHVSRKVQKQALFEVSRSENDFAIPLLAGVIAENSDVAESFPQLKETLFSKILDDPEILSDLLSNTLEPPIKALLVEAAGEIRFEKALPILLDILTNEEDVKIIESTIIALGMIAAPSAVTAVSEFLYSRNREIVIASIRTLGALATPEAIQKLGDRLGKDSDLDLMIIDIISKIQIPEALEMLNQTLGSQHAHLRAAVKQKLGGVGVMSIRILIKNLFIDHPDLVIHSLNVLGDIGDSAAIPAIRKLIHHQPEDPNVRFAAYETLGRLPLDKGVYTLAAGLNDPVDNVRNAAAKAIDRHYNAALAGGIRNLIRSGEPEDLKIMTTIIDSQCDTIFLDLLEEDYFHTSAIDYLTNKAHPDVRSYFTRILENAGQDDLAKKIMPKKTAKEKATLKVFAVDDSKMILNIYRTVLYNLGCESHLFEFPAKALQRVQKEKPDVILTDLNMPDITGIEFTKGIRQWYSKSELPIIMVTTQKEAQENKAAYAAGVNDIIHKPFTEAQIGKALAKFSGR